MTIILAGYKDDIENKLYAFNPGMASRFQNVVFDDFNEFELGQVRNKHPCAHWMC